MFYGIYIEGSLLALLYYLAYPHTFIKIITFRKYRYLLFELYETIDL